MSLEQTGLNKRYIERLSAAIKNEKLVHAYIFENDACIEQEQLAREFAKAVLCLKRSGTACDECISCRKVNHDNHEDIIYVRPGEKGSIKVEAVEELRDKLKRKPLGDRTVAVIYQAETMNEIAQNKLLKTLEEPVGNSIIIMLTGNAENLIQTIRSRCVIFRINDYSSIPQNETLARAEELANMMISRVPTYELFQKIEDIKGDRTATLELLDALEFVYREILLGKNPSSRLYKRQYIYGAVDIIETAKRQLNSVVGLNAGYMLRNVLLKIGG